MFKIEYKITSYKMGNAEFKVYNFQRLLSQGNQLGKSNTLNDEKMKVRRPTVQWDKQIIAKDPNEEDFE